MVKDDGQKEMEDRNKIINEKDYACRRFKKKKYYLPSY